MKRLTERFSNGQVAVAGCGSQCQHGFIYCENIPDENRCSREWSLCPTIDEILEKLAEYEDAEEQGLLERLKVNVGDVVWIITKPANFSLGIWRDITLSMAEQRKVKLITLTKDEVQYHTKERMYCEKDFGEIVFLTKEEAEQALAKMKGGLYGF